MTTLPQPPDNPDRDHRDDIDSSLANDWEAFSLEDLGAAYAAAVTVQEESDRVDRPLGDDGATDGGDVDHGHSNHHPGQGDEPFGDGLDGDPDASLSPAAIIEAILFVGNPKNRAITEQQLAAVMRGVSPREVLEQIDLLNQSYESNGQALRLIRDDDGWRMGVASDLEVVRRAFYGKIRETRLSQAAIEVLSLVAYQPGITAEKVQDQRGKESANLLSQLVRRRILEQRRVVREGQKRPEATYWPTERFLELFGLQSIEDLPHVEE